MKIQISQDELKQIVSDFLTTKFGSDYAFDCSNVSAYSDWTFEEANPDYLAAKAKDEAAMEEFRIKWAADAKAKEEADAAAKLCLDNAVTGNKS